MSAVILIFPPAATPEQPVLSLPALAGFLRNRGVEVCIEDFNVEACHTLPAPEKVDKYAQRIRVNLSTPELPYDWKKKAAGILVQENFLRQNLETAKVILRDRRFYQPAKRQWALRTIQQGLALVSAAYFPVKWGWAQFECAFRPDVSADILQAARYPDSTPFTEFFKHQITKKILPRTPLLIGISICYVDQVIPAFRLLHLIKEIIPSVHCTIGGAVFTRLAEDLPQSPNLFSLCDSFVVNEGETALWTLYQALKRRKSLREVPNLIYKSGKEIKTNPFILEKVDQLPPPSFDGFAFNRYFLPETVLHLETSRGCYWGKCTFCNLPRVSIERKHRPFPLDKLADRVIKICSRNKSNRVIFWDEAVPPDALRALSQGFMEKKVSIKWHAEVRFDPALDKPLLELMARAGCRGLFIGLESAHGNTLRRMGRGVRPEMMSRILSWCREAGIHVMAAWFAGFPGESRTQAEETCRFLLERRRLIGDAWSPGVFVLRRHSLIEHHPQRFGVRITKDPTADLALRFSYEVDCGLGMEEADDLRREFLHRFHAEGLGWEQRYGPGYLLYQDYLSEISPALEQPRDKGRLMKYLDSQAKPALAGSVRKESIPVSQEGGEVTLSFLIQEENGEVIPRNESDEMDFLLSQIDGKKNLNQIKKSFREKFGSRSDWLALYVQLAGRGIIHIPAGRASMSLT